MADVVDKATRSRMMAGIRAKNTIPERIVRKELFARGIRFRLHAKGLSGRPDLVLRKYRAVIFVHGCFWHGHDCKFFRMPRTNIRFWEAKINGNKKRDAENASKLRREGWRVLVLWECALRGLCEYKLDLVMARVYGWLHSKNRFSEMRGR